MEKAREFQKNIYLCFIDYARAFDCVDHNQLWKILNFPGGSGSKVSVYMRETWDRSLGREDPLEKEMSTHSSTLARKIPWTGEPVRLQPMGSI